MKKHHHTSWRTYVQFKLNIAIYLAHLIELETKTKIESTFDDTKHVKCRSKSICTFEKDICYVAKHSLYSHDGTYMSGVLLDAQLKQ